MERMIVCKLKNKGGGWYEIAKVGKWKGHKVGEFELTKEDLNQIVFNFQNIGLDVVVDYEHQTLSGQTAPASGWIKAKDGLKVEKDSLLALIEWTPKAKESIKQKEYRYLSPVLIQNTKDNKSGNIIGWSLHSVALTNTPFFTELEPISAKSNHNKEENMSKEELEKLKKENEDLKKEIKTLKEMVKKAKEVAAKQKVSEAISAKKITKEQESWAVEYALKDEKGFEEFIKNAKAVVEVPSSNQFAASNKPGDIDVVKLALGGDDE